MDGAVVVVVVVTDALVAVVLVAGAVVVGAVVTGGVAVGVDVTGGGVAVVTGEDAGTLGDSAFGVEAGTVGATRSFGVEVANVRAQCVPGAVAAEATAAAAAKSRRATTAPHEMIRPLGTQVLAIGPLGTVSHFAGAAAGAGVPSSSRPSGTCPHEVTTGDAGRQRRPVAGWRAPP
jgi:hypothetical protein